MNDVSRHVPTIGCGDAGHHGAPSFSSLLAEVEAPVRISRNHFALVEVLVHDLRVPARRWSGRAPGPYPAGAMPAFLTWAEIPILHISRR